MWLCTYICETVNTYLWLRTHICVTVHTFGSLKHVDISVCNERHHEPRPIRQRDPQFIYSQCHPLVGLFTISNLKHPPDPWLAGPDPWPVGPDPCPVGPDPWQAGPDPCLVGPDSWPVRPDPGWWDLIPGRLDLILCWWDLIPSLWDLIPGQWDLIPCWWDHLLGQGGSFCLQATHHQLFSIVDYAYCVNVLATFQY